MIFKRLAPITTSYLFSFSLLFSILHVASGQVGLTNTLESVGGTVERSELFVHTSLFAKLPSGQRPNFITNFQDDLIVSTLGSIFRIDVNTREVTVLLDLNEAVIAASGGDRELEFDNRQHGGLRSVAFHPIETDLMYVSMMETRPSDPSNFEYLTDTPDAQVDSVVAEFRLSEDRRSVIEGSYRTVLRIGVPFVPGGIIYDHPIKTIAFRDDQLYIAHGDAADQQASTGGGQNNDAFGKILRINPLMDTNLGLNYTVSSQNPFVGDPNMLDEVYALGFRNPHHICFGNGRILYVAETGRATVEEVDLVRGGENFGWSLREGPFVFSLGGISELPEDDAELGLTYPSAAYGHLPPGTGQAIAGGCPITNRSPVRGLYLYTDFPVFGYLFFSSTRAMRRAQVSGDPDDLEMATTFQPFLCYDQEDGTSIQVDTLKDIIELDPGFETSSRADIRIGRGPDGVMYWTSKTNAGIYVFESSKVGGDISNCAA